ncbi:hypothetical protein [Amaricoccus solimangrovi]|uniref:Uncharacterized protein n=1 Tax=Amaricoccus solimangrovi TaxID=2589815 RepID=A0A501WC39_9RHOB|nr:hypothetical protein [Amaricoccus solimangrovi]TPE47169.1 hypothetical protein FJM51_20600 [Amaricoccus solimangrovi]
MPAYILRYEGTKLLAGIHAARSERELALLVDEETTPGDFEYAELRERFGIEFRTKDGAAVPYEIGTEPASPAGALATADYVYMTGTLSMALFTGEGLTWRRFFEH